MWLRDWRRSLNRAASAFRLGSTKTATGKIELDAEDMGEQELKNIARPVRVYRLKLDPPNLPPPNSTPDGSLQQCLPYYPCRARRPSVQRPRSLTRISQRRSRPPCATFIAQTSSRETLCCVRESTISVTSAGPPELQAWLSEAARAMFSNPRDEKLYE